MSAVFPIDSFSTTRSPLVLPPSSNQTPSASSVNGSSSNSLVLPPSAGNSQTSQSANAADGPSNALVLTSTNTTAGVGSPVSTTATPTTSTEPTTPTPPLNTATQPLNVVFNALASAGIDSAITQTILAPEASASNGTFSVFLSSLFNALAAQSVADQTAQANAAQASATNAANAADATNSNASSTADQTASAAANAFLANSNSTSPNSALENGVQALAQTVNSQTAVSTAVTANANAQASSVANNALSPLQQSFDQFLTDAGGTPAGATGLGNFLGALATNLHTAPTPLGNIVNTQT